MSLEFALSSRLNGTGDGHAANALERAYATALFSSLKVETTLQPGTLKASEAYWQHANSPLPIDDLRVPPKFRTASAEASCAQKPVDMTIEVPHNAEQGGGQ
ncbi:hypothetical protein CT0861_00451 [Colletotrichum tofieldiae]|uniref:Uncharacterized protein n=1 Tax=Colletotrichum tofieldiae TaxID=708197 RepID=A0A166R7U5_9PEZI|nr:hypothetical protein CT0861_00451 [Colletotrichum tofieldiae]